MQYVGSHVCACRIRFKNVTNKMFQTPIQASPLGVSEIRSPSMAKRIAAIVFIFVCASVAWAILGGSIFSRTYDLNEVSEKRVASTWGTAQNQSPPQASFMQINVRNEESLENGKQIVK